MTTHYSPLKFIIFSIGFCLGALATLLTLPPAPLSTFAPVAMMLGLAGGFGALAVAQDEAKK